MWRVCLGFAPIYGYCYCWFGETEDLSCTVLWLDRVCLRFCDSDSYSETVECFSLRLCVFACVFVNGEMRLHPCCSQTMAWRFAWPPWKGRAGGDGEREGQRKSFIIRHSLCSVARWLTAL